MVERDKKENKDTREKAVIEKIIFGGACNGYESKRCCGYCWAVFYGIFNIPLLSGICS